jgi:pyruvate,water dikinase
MAFLKVYSCGMGGLMQENNLIIRISELSKNQMDIVGKKCANLGELFKAGFRVPPGFALTLNAYDEFMNQTGTLEEIRNRLKTFSADPQDPHDLGQFKALSKSIREIVESKAMPEEMDDLVTRYYTELCEKTGNKEVSVATRSAGPVSHPGQYETYLYVKSLPDVKKHIVMVWGSTFNTRSLVARARKGLSLDHDPIGVAVIEMVNAKAAGVMFTACPNTADKSKIFIEGNWGLGESVVGGNVSPDTWVVDKYSYQIVDSKVSVKERECKLDPEKGRVSICEVSTERKKAFCLDEGEVIALAKVGTEIEKHFGVAQDIEWAVSGEAPHNLFVLQARPEKFNITLRVSGF